MIILIISIKQIEKIYRWKWVWWKFHSFYFVTNWFVRFSFYILSRKNKTRFSIYTAISSLIHGKFSLQFHYNVFCGKETLCLHLYLCWYLFISFKRTIREWFNVFWCVSFCVYSILIRLYQTTLALGSFNFPFSIFSWN